MKSNITIPAASLIQKLEERLIDLVQAECATLRQELEPISIPPSAEPEPGTPGFWLNSDATIQPLKYNVNTKLLLEQGNWHPDRKVLELRNKQRVLAAKVGPMPKMKDDYFAVDADGSIGSPELWMNDCIDYALYYFGNCFPSEAAAEAARPEVLAAMGVGQ